MQEYFHGLLLREDIVGLLRHDGEFLIRFAESRKGEKSFILSTMSKDTLEKGDGIKHFVIIKTQTGKYMIETWGFKSIPEMVIYFLKVWRCYIVTKNASCALPNGVVVE